MAPSRLVQSCATPPARLAAFQPLRTGAAGFPAAPFLLARSRSRSAWNSSRSVTSRTAAVTIRSSPVPVADRDISAGNVLPSRRRPASSIPAPIGRGRGSAAYPARCPGCTAAPRPGPAPPPAGRSSSRPYRTTAPPAHSPARSGHPRPRTPSHPAPPPAGRRTGPRPAAPGSDPGKWWYHSHDGPRAIGDWGRDERHRDGGPVLADPLGSARWTRSPRAMASRKARKWSRARPGARLDVAADHLPGGVPVEALSTRVPARDDVIEGLADDRVVRGLDD